MVLKAGLSLDHLVVVDLEELSEWKVPIHDQLMVELE